ncbi:GIY-YIG nuclease family protein [Pseudooceanicola atlanticus]|uniref:GIY-YIG nuclease family protein n=1 Tax=Pseudooceanicola atlanticus TaxID=1461694 RepID=UPI0023558987|nr:GIY-YIG nuclease family protein [Pseudooceanicola atlanticus]
MSKGYVYILSNKHMPGILKIGRTTGEVEARAQALYQTGVPSPFSVEFEIYTPDCVKAESDAHAYLQNHRVSSSREFFQCEISEAIKALKDIKQEQVEGLLSEFMPGHTLVEDQFFIDPGIIWEMSVGLDRQPFEVAEILNSYRIGDEINLSEPAARYDQRARQSREDEARESDK